MANEFYNKEKVETLFNLLDSKIVQRTDPHRIAKKFNVKRFHCNQEVPVENMHPITAFDRTDTYDNSDGKLLYTSITVFCSFADTTNNDPLICNYPASIVNLQFAKSDLMSTADIYSIYVDLFDDDPAESSTAKQVKSLVYLNYAIENKECGFIMLPNEKDISKFNEEAINCTIDDLLDIIISKILDADQGKESVYKWQILEDTEKTVG